MTTKKKKSFLYVRIRPTKSQLDLTHKLPNYFSSNSCCEISFTVDCRNVFFFQIAKLSTMRQIVLETGLEDEKLGNAISCRYFEMWRQCSHAFDVVVWKDFRIQQIVVDCQQLSGDLNFGNKITPKKKKKESDAWQKALYSLNYSRANGSALSNFPYSFPSLHIMETIRTWMREFIYY